MRVVSCQVRPGGGALTETTGNARGRWTARHGAWLILRDADGRQGIGEASPLPGYSPDTLEAAQASLATAAPGDLDVDESAPIAGELARCSGLLPETCPSARFAMETALLDLLSRRLGRPAWHLLRAPALAPPIPLPLTALLPNLDVTQALRSAHQARDRGITTFKIKVGPGVVQRQQLDLLNALRDTFQQSVRLRIDANQSLDAERLPRQLDQLAQYEPEWVEEPSAAPDTWLDAPVRLALDESLQRADAPTRVTQWAQGTPLAALVLKPAALGGISRCLDLADVAAQLHLKVVISHLLDGPVALAACSALALVANSPDLACGLDAHPGLSAWATLPLPFLTPSSIVPYEAPGLGIDWPEP